MKRIDKRRRLLYTLDMSEEKKAAAAKYHRKTMLAAADRLLVEHGYDGMNMNMLCKEAGYSKATVYVYFKSKDEIVESLALDRLLLFEKEAALVAKNDFTKEEKLAEIKKLLDEFVKEDGVYFYFICEHARSGQLFDTVNRIVDSLEDVAPRDEILKAWYAYYGELKTKAMFTD